MTPKFLAQRVLSGQDLDDAELLYLLANSNGFEFIQAATGYTDNVRRFAEIHARNQHIQGMVFVFIHGTGGKRKVQRADTRKCPRYLGSFGGRLVFYSQRGIPALGRASCAFSKEGGAEDASYPGKIMSRKVMAMVPAKKPITIKVLQVEQSAVPTDTTPKKSRAKPYTTFWFQGDNRFHNGSSLVKIKLKRILPDEEIEALCKEWGGRIRCLVDFEASLEDRRNVDVSAQSPEGRGSIRILGLQNCQYIDRLLQGGAVNITIQEDYVLSDAKTLQYVCVHTNESQREREEGMQDAVKIAPPVNAIEVEEAYGTELERATRDCGLTAESVEEAMGTMDVCIVDGSSMHFVPIVSVLTNTSPDKVRKKFWKYITEGDVGKLFLDLSEECRKFCEKGVVGEKGNGLFFKCFSERLKKREASMGARGEEGMDTWGDSSNGRINRKRKLLPK